MSDPGSHTSRKLGPAEFLEESDIRAMLAQFSTRSPAAIRNRAIVLTLWRTGVRIGELLALERKDLQLDGPTPRLTVCKGKFGKQRVIGIHQEAQVAIERWLERKQWLGIDRLPIVFCTFSSNNSGAPIHDKYVRQMLNRYAKRAGVTARVHPHAFRATLAVELAREGVPLPAIRDVLGHSNIGATDAYLRRVFPADAIDAVINRKAITPGDHHVSHHTRKPVPQRDHH